MIGATYLALF